MGGAFPEQLSSVGCTEDFVPLIRSLQSDQSESWIGISDRFRYSYHAWAMQAKAWIPDLERKMTGSSETGLSRRMYRTFSIKLQSQDAG